MSISLEDLPPKFREQAMIKLAIEEARKRNKAAEIPGSAPTEEEPPKQNKYHAQKTERMMPNGDVHVFDSKREAERYDELALMFQSGKIRNLKLQPQFTLQESYIAANGERIRAIRYVADFSYEMLETNAYQKDGGCSYEYIDEFRRVVEDVKSKATRTAQYKMKRKMLQEVYGITVSEV